MTDRRPTVTAAVAAFDRHVPLFLGAVAEHSDFRVEWLDVGMTAPGRHGLRRHARMLHEQEFDVAEVSLSSYIMARRRGAPFTAAPVFPRRLFTPPCLYVPAASPVRHPSELAGGSIAIRAFQVTLSVQAKGDLQREYDLPWRDIHWFTRESETIPWAGAEGVRVDPIPDGWTIADMMATGDLNAMIDPFPPPALLAEGVIRPLFADSLSESADYFTRRGYFPIMHVMAIREDSIARHPALGAYLVEAWEEAKRIAAKAYDDPAYTLFPALAAELQERKRRFGSDPWPSGLAANLANLRDFIADMVDQRLIDAPFDPAELFHPSTL